MRAGATPELTASWWKKNKAKTLTQTGVSKALLNYEKWATLDRNADIPKQIRALEDVKRAVQSASRKANPRLHRETIAALKNYPKVIDARLTVLRRQQAAVPAAASRRSEVVIWERDIAKELNRWLNTNRAKFGEELPRVPRGMIKLKLNDDILDILEENKDLVTPAQMVEDAQKAWVRAEKDIQRILLDWIENRRKTPNADAEANDSIDKRLKSLTTELEKIPDERWRRLTARRQQYAKYKTEAKVDAAWEAFNFGAGVALTVGSGGTSLALGIVGLVKSAASLVGMLYDACIEAETVHKSLSKDLTALRLNYLNFHGTAKKSLGPKELAKATATGVLGEVARPFLQSIPRCESNFELWSNKVDGLAVKGRKCSATIVDAMNECQKYENLLAKDRSKRVKKLMKDVQKLRLSLDKALDKTHGVMERVRNADQKKPAVERDLNELKDARSKPVAVLSKVIPHVCEIGLGIWGGKVEVDGAKDAVDMIKACSGIAKDIVGEAKAIYGDVK